MDYTKIYETEIDGFLIRFETTPEDMHPNEHFDQDFDDIDKICRDIEAGRLAWFVAKVSAHKSGIELSADYLGACLYQNPMQFVRDNDYFYDMCEHVVAEAKTVIQQLTEA